MGDITALIPDELADVCILEEPEHLNWFKAPFEGEKTWTEKVGKINIRSVSYFLSHCELIY